MAIEELPKFTREQMLGTLDEVITMINPIGVLRENATDFVRSVKIFFYGDSVFEEYTKQDGLWLNAKKSPTSPWKVGSIEDINVPHNGMFSIDIKPVSARGPFPLTIDTNRIIEYLPLGIMFYYKERVFDYSPGKRREVIWVDVGGLLDEPAKKLTKREEMYRGKGAPFDEPF